MKLKIRKLFLLLIFTIIGLSTPALAQDTGLPSTLNIMDHEVVLKDQVNHGQQGFIAEYISLEETWDNWTFLFAVRFIPGKELDPIASAQATAKNIEDLKATDPVANYSIFTNDSKTEAIVDFLISNLHNNNLDMFEHNVWRFLKVPNGVLAYQVARRIYLTKDNQKQTEDFVKNISEIRNQIFKDINRADLPIPKFAQ